MQQIPLTKGFHAIVDDEWYDLLIQFKWHAIDSHPYIVYAARWKSGSKPRKAVRMHHVILGVDPIELVNQRLVVDHIDRNGLNNIKSNLRIATRAENILNSSHCDDARGIYYEISRNRWKAFCLQPTKVYIGTYKTYEEAYLAKVKYEEDLHR